MTKEEAIEILKADSCVDCGVGSQSPFSCTFDGHCDIKDAMEMAIKALEQETTKDCLEVGDCQHGTCKDCKNNRKNPYARKHYTCELGNRYKLRDCDNFYCADFEKRGEENERTD